MKIERRIEKVKEMRSSFFEISIPHSITTTKPTLVEQIPPATTAGYRTTQT